MSVESILRALAEQSGQARRSKASLIANTVSGLASVPGQIIAGREQEAQRQRAQAAQDEQLALQRAQGVRATNADTRATADQAAQDAATAQATKKEAALRTAIAAGFAGGTDPKDFDEKAAIRAATDAGFPDLAVTITETHRKLQPEKPKLTPNVDPTKSVIDDTGKVVVPAVSAPVKPDKLTYGQPITAVVDGKRTLVRAGSDGKYYDVRGGTVIPDPDTKDTKPDEPALDLTPEALTLTAHQYAMTGQLPPMGMGKQGAAVRTKIINEAAKAYAGLDLPTQVAAYNANKESLKKLQGQRDAIGAFENTAAKNIDTFLATAGKVVDTGSPLANTLVRQVSGKLLGSPDQAAFDAARQVAINEIAKIVSNPNLSGTLSDSARHEVEAFNPQNATLAQSVAVMRLLKQDMQNRTGSLDEQIKDVQGRIATPPGSKGKDSTDRIPVIGPNGETGTVPAGTTLPAGWKKRTP